MTIRDEERFKAFANVRQVELCCGTCRHFERNWEQSGCAHPKQRDFDSFAGEYENYGAYGGTEIDEGFVCDLWEKKEDADAE